MSRKLLADANGHAKMPQRVDGLAAKWLTRCQPSAQLSANIEASEYRKRRINAGYQAKEAQYVYCRKYEHHQHRRQNDRKYDRKQRRRDLRKEAEIGIAALNKPDLTKSIAKQLLTMAAGKLASSRAALKTEYDVKYFQANTDIKRRLR